MPETGQLAGLLSMDVSAAPRGGGREYRAYPSLGRPRWLLPAGRADLRRAGMRELFRPGSLRGRALKAAISAGVVPGQRVFLEQEPLSRLEAEISGALGQDDARVAFYVGTPGAYRKVTALVTGPDGATLAFAKLASAPLARDDIAAEHRNLLRLAEATSLRGRVPESLATFDWQDSRVLLMSPGPPHPGPDRFTGEHGLFCRDLFVPFAETRTYADGPMLQRISRRTRRVREGMQGPLPALLERALERLTEELGPVSLPLSMAHRDFAPWNTREGARGLFVFDWDHAEEGVTPLYDAFHFFAIQAILFGREAAPDRGLLLDLLAPVWPEGREHLAALHLAYLLDMALFYAEARVVAPDAGEGGAVTWFAQRLEERLNGDPQN